MSDTLLGGHQGVASSLSTALNYAKDKGLFNDITKGRTSDRYSEWKEEDVTTGVASVDTIFQKYDVARGVRAHCSSLFRVSHRRNMYDQFGREMTQRELWRQLNHQFHGIKPSAKRSERELESYKRELSAKKKANADTPLGSMQMLKAATKVTAAISIMLIPYRLKHCVCALDEPLSRVPSLCVCAVSVRVCAVSVRVCAVSVRVFRADALALRSRASTSWSASRSSRTSCQNRSDM